MRIAIINKSDSVGGAAVVSFRLMEALRMEGIDARMIVVEKLSASPYVKVAATGWKVKDKFLKERLKIFIANGFNRKTLFRIDTGECGLPIWKDPFVKEADAILLNWVNQGMLSLKGVKKLLKTGKPVIWTMHDMWCMTGICHHAYSCRHFQDKCGNCPLLGNNKGGKDLSFKIWKRKDSIYGPGVKNGGKPVFVAVSRWLRKRSQESALLGNQNVRVIPNAFNIPDKFANRKAKTDSSEIRILFGAARLDDPIKGLDVLKEMARELAENNLELASRLKIVTFGTAKNPDSLNGFRLPVEHLGQLEVSEVRNAYEGCDILVSSSSYETLPGTLVEAQAYGCIPVSFDRGGQHDIIEHLSSGYLASYDEDISERGKRLAEGVKWAVGIMGNETSYSVIIRKMRENVEKKFSYERVARQYIDLINETKDSI